MSDRFINNTAEGKALAGLITELNIARRNYHSYPKGHPLIDASLHKVVHLYSGLMTTAQEILIGVTRDLLIIDSVPLDKSNLVFRNFAKVLFERGIGTLQLESGLTVDELKRFVIVLGLKREDIQQRGGIEQIWAKAGIRSLSIRPIRYDLLKTTEETAVSPEPGSHNNLWERFANALASDEAIGGNCSASGEFDPKLLADALNRYYSNNPSAFAVSSSLGSVSEVMRNSGNTRVTLSNDGDLPYQKLADFVQYLNPELRRQLLSKSFESSSSVLSPHAEKLFSSLSSEMISSTLEDAKENRLSIPPVITGLLKKLGGHADPQHENLDHLMNTRDQNFFDRDEVGSRMKTLLREQASEQFVPELYQVKLDKIMAADQIQIIQSEDIEQLQDALSPKLIDNRISEIILQLVLIDSAAGDTDALARNLNSMCAYFLEIGDYQQLIKIVNDSLDQRLPESFRDAIRSFIAQKSFIEEVLNGLHTWGKPCFEQIRKLIDQIGEPCIEPILDALAEENSMSLRRFLIERLLELGPLAGPPIIDRLSDPRWYYLRNLIGILRTINDASAVEGLKPLCLHADARVRLEAIKTLLHFRDSSIEQKILNDMDSSDHQMKLEAIRMAEKSNSPEIAGKLLSILKRSGLSNSEYELKSAVVHSLGQLGYKEALPEFGKILGSRNLLHPLLLNKLKLDIVYSLEHYPVAIAKSILERIADGKDEVAIQAAAALKKVLAGQP